MYIIKSNVYIMKPFNLPNYLNNLKKPELVEIARAVNELSNIKGVQGMKKRDLIVELLVRSQHTRKVIDKDIKPKRTRNIKKQKLTKEEENDLFKQIQELNKKAVKEKKIGVKSQLLKEIEILNKKLLKSL